MYPANHPSKTVLVVFRVVFYFMAFYFLAMGLMLALLPRLLTQPAGELPGVILGMLRGAGGGIIPYSLMYVLVAQKPMQRRLLARVIAAANILAVILDFTSVFLGEYRLLYAMFDVPFELLSLTAIVVFYSAPGARGSSEMKA